MIRTDDGYDDVCDSDGEWWMSTMMVILMILIMMMINRYDQPSPSTPSATPCLSSLFRILHPSFGAVVVKPLNSLSFLIQLICSWKGWKDLTPWFHNIELKKGKDDNRKWKWAHASSRENRSPWNEPSHQLLILCAWDGGKWTIQRHGACLYKTKKAFICLTTR